MKCNDAKAKFYIRNSGSWTSLTVQWLRLQASSEGGVSSIPGWGINIPHASRCDQKKNGGSRDKGSVLNFSGSFNFSTLWPGIAESEDNVSTLLLGVMHALGVSFPGGASGKESTCRCRRHRFHPWKIPWRRKWQPIPVFLLGKFHGQRSLVDYSPWSYRVGYDWVTKQQQ